LDGKEKNEIKDKKKSTLDLTYKCAKKTGCLIKGLNVEYCCKNELCINYKRTVIIPFGTG